MTPTPQGSASRQSLPDVGRGCSFGRWRPGLLARLDDAELGHHATVLMPEQVAVDHVRVVRVGIAGEAHREPHGVAVAEEEGVVPPGLVADRRTSVHIEHLEPRAVHVDVVRLSVGVPDLPDLRLADGDDLVDAARVHVPPVDVRAAHAEGSCRGRTGIDEVTVQVRGGREPVGQRR